MVFIELHVIHALSEFFKHQCSTHSTVLVEYLIIILLFSDLLDLHDIGGKFNSPNHPNRNSLRCVLNISVKLFKVDSKLWHSVCDSVSVDKLFKLMLIYHFETTLGINKVEDNLLKLCV